jgi:hypothetical protein
MGRTPPLLRKMLEIPIGDIIVRGNSIVEPVSTCRIAHGFPSKDAAIKAAQEMNEVADWIGIVKTRAEGRSPNCQDELRRIAEAYGGVLSDGGGQLGEVFCAAVVAKIEAQ